MKMKAGETAFWRLLLITVAAIVVAMVVPVSGDRASAEMLLAVAVFVAAVYVHLLAVAATRKDKLFEAVRIELNKIRRVYHISKNLAASDGKYRTWFTELHGFVYDYLTAFAGKDFDAYDEFNGKFRALSYHVYTIPEIESRKDAALYQDLLRTTASVAEARQQIKELWDRGMSAYSWTVVGILTGAYVVAALCAMNGTMSSRLVGGLSVAAALLAADLLRVTDTLSGEKKIMAERYADNVRRLELGRHE
jgi:hypothetical protein